MQILRLLGLEIASQQFGITSLRLECHQREHRALFLEKKAECTRVEANTLQGACTIIKEENAARTMNGLAVTHRALEQAVQLRDLKKELHDLRDSEAELQVPTVSFPRRITVPVSCIICVRLKGGVVEGTTFCGKFQTAEAGEGPA